MVQHESGCCASIVKTAVEMLPHDKTSRTITTTTTTQHHNNSGCSSCGMKATMVWRLLV